MDNLIDKVHQLMLRNRRVKGNFQYTIPSPDSYPYQWLWDSCFHAIILSYFNPEDAKKELISLVSKQFANGMIPHMIYWDNIASSNLKNPFPRINWGKKDTSTITQPPMLAYASLKIYQADNDKSFLEQIYPSIRKFYQYLILQRDPHHRNLAGIINPDESGEDNSPRFDNVLELSYKQTAEENFKKRLKLIEKNKTCNFDAPRCMRNFFWVKDVPFNTILVKNLLCLEEIASILDKIYDSEFFRIQAEDIKTAMRKLMLEDGIFWSTYGPDYRKIKVVTWAILAPLFAEIATPKEAASLVKDYLLKNDKFNLNFMVPTVPKDEPSFDPKGFWRGPVWMATNWFVFQGLKKYGYHDEAQKILDSSLKLLEKSGFREQFNPLSGEGLGAHNFTWGGLVLDMQQSLKRS